MAIGLTLRQFFIRIFIVGISKFCGGNETYPCLDDDLIYTLHLFGPKLWKTFGENGLWKWRVCAHRLNISAKLFREN